MENIEIARVFLDIVNLMEIKGDNPFRIRSYKFAIEIIEGKECIVRNLILDLEDD